MVNDCKRAIVMAKEAVRRRGGNHIGTEHRPHGLIGEIAAPDRE